MNTSGRSQQPVNVIANPRYPQLLGSRDVIQVVKNVPESVIEFYLSGIAQDSFMIGAASTIFNVETENGSVITLASGRAVNGDSLDGVYSLVSNYRGSNIANLTTSGTTPGLTLGEHMVDPTEVWTIRCRCTPPMDGDNGPSMVITGSLHPGMEWNDGILNIYFSWPRICVFNLSAPSGYAMDAFLRETGRVVRGLNSGAVVQSAPVVTLKDATDKLAIDMAMPKSHTPVPVEPETRADMVTTLDSLVFYVYLQNTTAAPFRVKKWCVTESATPPPENSTLWVNNVLDTGPYAPWRNGGWGEGGTVEDQFDVLDDLNGDGGLVFRVALSKLGARTIYLHATDFQGNFVVVPRLVNITAKVNQAPSDITFKYATRPMSSFVPARVKPFISDVTVVDPNYNDAQWATLTTVAGDGDADNGLIDRIVPAQGYESRDAAVDDWGVFWLYFAPYFVPEARVYNFRLKGTDAGGLSFEKAFTYEVTA